MMKPLTARHHTRAQLRGTAIVPMMTPVTADGRLDEPAVARIVEHIIAGGCQGLMVCGTTGEFASMSLPQRVRLVQLTVAAARGRALVFGGIGDTVLDHSLALAREFSTAGADAVVATNPAYYPLTPDMMERYFTRLADGVAGPLYLYNIPQTTRQSIPLEVIARLSRHPRIAGIKDSEPDAARQQAVARLGADRDDFVFFCGNVAQASVALRAGADGYIPSAGNFAPRLARGLIDALLSGEAAAGEAAQRRMDAFNTLTQKGRNLAESLAALKGLLETAGLCHRHMLAPLVAVTDAELEQIRGGLRELGEVS